MIQYYKKCSSSTNAAIVLMQFNENHHMVFLDIRGKEDTEKIIQK